MEAVMAARPVRLTSVRQYAPFCCLLNVWIMVWFLHLNIVVATSRAVTVKDLNPTSKSIIWALHVGHVSGLVRVQCWVVLEACCKREGGARNSVVLSLQTRPWPHVQVWRMRELLRSCWFLMPDPTPQLWPTEQREEAANVKVHRDKQIPVCSSWTCCVEWALEHSLGQAGILVLTLWEHIPLLTHAICYPRYIAAGPQGFSRNAAYLLLETRNSAAGYNQTMCIEALAAVAAALSDCFCLCCVQSITQTVKSCSWAWPTSTPSATVSSICVLFAARYETLASKWPYSS